MKRPVTFFLVISMLAGASAFAGALAPAAREVVAAKNAQHDGQRGNGGRNEGHRNDRPHDNGHRDNRHDNNDHRGDNRGHGGNDWNDRNRNDHRNDYRNDHRNDYRNDHRNDYNNNRWDNYRSDWNRHPNYWDNRRHDRVDYARYRYNYGHYHAPRGYYYRTWHRGEHLPRGWYGNSFVVYDWRPYRLYSPPYGYHWVRVGNDVVLTALATGLVLDVIYNIWY
jgi:Ni/Co efflux regulator RcnB